MGFLFLQLTGFQKTHTMINKRYLFFILALFLIPQFSFATVLDSYDFSNRNGLQFFDDANGYRKCQSFTGSTSEVISRVDVVWGKLGSPTGNMAIEIYAHTGSFGTSSVPTGSVLATSDTVDVSTAPSYLSPASQSFIFSGAEQIVLSDTNYVLCGYFPVAVESDNDSIGVGTDDSSPTHSGNYSQYNSGAFTAYSGIDMVFKIFTEVASTPTPTPSQSTATNSLSDISTFGSVLFYAVILFMLSFLFPIWFYGNRIRGRQII